MHVNLVFALFENKVLGKFLTEDYRLYHRNHILPLSKCNTLIFYVRVFWEKCYICFRMEESQIMTGGCEYMTIIFFIDWVCEMYKVWYFFTWIIFVLSQVLCLILASCNMCMGTLTLHFRPNDLLSHFDMYCVRHEYVSPSNVGLFNGFSLVDWCVEPEWNNEHQQIAIDYTFLWIYSHFFKGYYLYVRLKVVTRHTSYSFVLFVKWCEYMPNWNLDCNFSETACREGCVPVICWKGERP